MSDEAPRRQFSPRDVNILKINSLIDAEIFLRECEFSLKSIEEQGKEPFFANDADWRRDAKRAELEIIHKRDLCLLKRTILLKKEVPKAPEDEFRTQFFKAAQQILSSESFEEIRALAMGMRAA